MTLSADLQTRYATEVDVDWHHALILSHPSATTRYLIGHTSGQLGAVDGHLQLFRPVAITLTPYGADDSGRQEMPITIDGLGIGSEARAFMGQCLQDPSEPVLVRYTRYLEADTTAQDSPLVEFHMSQPIITRNSVAFGATRADIINRTFPTELYSAAKFPGLRR